MTSRAVLLPLLALPFAAFATVPERVDPEVTITPGEGLFKIEIGGEEFTTYHVADGPRPYLWPVRGPGGALLTRDYPMKETTPGEATDHPHHRSIWFAHGDVNGHDFWHGGEARIVHQEVLELVSGEAIGVLKTRNHWMAGDERVCSEERTLRFFETDGVRFIDFEVLVRAGEKPVTFGDTKEGTMAIRLTPTLRLKGDVAQGKSRNSAGHENNDCWGKRAAWAIYSGPVDGKPVAVTMFDHPENPSHPTWWHARDYGLFAANPFGVHDFEKKPAGTGDHVIEPGGTMRLRYRIAFHSGEVVDEALNAELKRFGAEKR